MKVFVAFAVLLVAVAANDIRQDDLEGSCSRKMDVACAETNKKAAIDTHCDSKYAGFGDSILHDLQEFANAHIIRSFNYLKMATYYGNVDKNRAGFEKLLRGLSDAKWNDAIDVIKYMTQRGGHMDFNHRRLPASLTHELHELPTLARALDIEKQLAEEANSIHLRASKSHHDPKDKVYDAGVAHYIEEEFVEDQAGLIRKLAGYTNDLKNLLKTNDKSLAVYLFDEYLAKQ